MNIRERLGKELLFLDGGMGTLLQAEGLAPGELPETWNIEHPEKVEAIHLFSGVIDQRDNGSN